MDALKTSQDGDGAASELPGLPEGMEERFITVDDVTLPRHFQTNRPMKEHLQGVRSLGLKEDDVLLCAYPRSGTHWLWEVGSMLLAGRAEHGHRTKEHSMLEGTPLEDLQSLPSPRLLNTHLPVHFLPSQVKDKKVKVIFVYRNVKDVFMSLYHFVQRRKGFDFKGTIEEYLRYFNSEKWGPLGTYVDYMKKMDCFFKENPNMPVFSVPYEDMMENPEQTVKKLGDFLGVNPDPQLCTAIAEACSFQKLQAADNSRVRPQHLKTDCLYRKGLVGDWKNYLTVAQSEAFDEAMKRLEGCDFRFRYEL
ncbi:sulfotransferase 1A1-like [Babylonia areolata]|uniref:sulfotransferase 1A1-like n=1 Tax=Babylonia areolata TaxID=304850 RepID=UPI003FD0AD9E